MYKCLSRSVAETHYHGAGMFFFFFFFHYSDCNQQVDYSVAFEREVGTAKTKLKKNPKNKTRVAGLEALDTKVSMVVASTVLWGRLFQSPPVC